MSEDDPDQVYRLTLTDADGSPTRYRIYADSEAEALQRMIELHWDAEVSVQRGEAIAPETLDVTWELDDE